MGLRTQRGLGLMAVAAAFYLLSLVSQLSGGGGVELLAQSGLAAGFLLVATLAMVAGLGMVALGLFRDS